jgi:hypothetical protein
MRIVNAAGQAQMPEPARISSFGLPVTLDEGDSFSADVISSGNGSAVLKTEDGRIFHAKLDGGTALTPGENVELVVDGKSDGVITLTIVREDGIAAGESAGRGGLAIESAPAPAAVTDALGQLLTLGDIAARLETLGLPSDAATVSKVAKLLLSHPELSANEAVFVAAQGLDDAPDTLVSVKALLSGGETLDETLTEIQRLLEDIAPAPVAAHAPVPEPLPLAQYGAPERAEGAEAPDGERTYISPQLDSGAAPQLQDAAPQLAVGEQAPSVTPAATAPAAPASGGAEAAETASAASGAAISAAVVAQEIPPRDAASGGGLRARAEPDDGGAPPLPRPEEAVPSGVAPPGTAPDGAAYARAPQATGRKSAADFIKDMFVQIRSEDGEGTARRLRDVRSELPARAALLAASAARYGAAGADAVADRAGKVAEQARVMNSAEQYAYAQFPVAISGEDTTAELYVFKRKKAAISPEDANILLSLNLPSLGHWEATVNVRGHDVSLQMRAADDGAREHISGSTARLHELLSEAGYRLTGARVTCESAAAATVLTACSRVTARPRDGIDVVV